MFLDVLRRRNPRLVEAAVALHRSGEIPPNAYVLDLDGDFRAHCNTEMADLVALEEGAEIAEVRQMIERHLVYTGSPRAAQILDLPPRGQSPPPG